MCRVQMGVRGVALRALPPALHPLGSATVPALGPSGNSHAVSALSGRGAGKEPVGPGLGVLWPDS